MSHRAARAAVLTLLLAAAAAAPAAAASPARVVFPSDRLTVRDARQATGLRVNLPRHDCARRPSDCDEVRLIDQLDGFDVDPRLEIRFGRTVSLSRAEAGITLRVARGGPRIGIDRLVWDGARHTLYAHPSKQLQAARAYRIDVSAHVAGRAASASFTTMSATATLRRMVTAIDSGGAYDQVGIRPGRRRLEIEHSFPAAAVTRIQRVTQTTTTGPLTAEDVPNTATASAGTYAFGSFEAPGWLSGDRVIAAAPTRRTPRARLNEEIGFALIVPAGTPPSGGWPVAIFGHGFGRSKFDVFLAADRNAARGVATIAIDAVGHGGGPRSAFEVTTPAGVTRLAAHARSSDTDGDGAISFVESIGAPLPPDRSAGVQLRDGLRQTALDVAALAHGIGLGVDVDGDGRRDLSRSRIGYYGQSLGGIYGTLAVAADPALEYGLLNVPGGPIGEIARLSPDFRGLVAADLRLRRPQLLNGGRTGFTEDQPLPGDPPVRRPARGAIAIQAALARTNWIDRAGSPEAFAPLLRGRRVLVQAAYGDPTVPNPTTGFLVRAGGLLGRTTMYRNDRTATAATNPHGFLLDPRLTGHADGQREAVDFLASDGTRIVDPDASAGVFTRARAQDLLGLHFTP